MGDVASGVGVLGDVLAPALAIAASPFTIIPAILMLLTPRAAATSGAFLAGWLLGLGATATVFTLLATVIEAFEETPTWASWARIALGAALLFFGVLKWLQRRTPKPPPAWMSSIETATPPKAFRLAIVLAVANPKVLAFAAAAGLTIGAAELTPADSAASVVVFTVVASLGVMVPVLLYLVLRERMITPLTKARDWLERHNAAVMSIVFAVIGVMLLTEGISALR